MKFRSKVNVVALIALSWSFAATAGGDSGKRHLPVNVVHEICGKYDGDFAFVRNGEVTKIDCLYVDGLAGIDGPTLVEIYRKVLEHAGTLPALRKSRDLPADLSCGQFDEEERGAERVIQCRSELGGQDVPFTFFADKDGRLLRFETKFDFRKIYRNTLEGAVHRGSIAKFYNAYVDLHVDLLVEKLRYTAIGRDSVTVDDGQVDVVVYP